MIILLHAGLHRTASTSFQKWLRDNAPRLHGHGVMTAFHSAEGEARLSCLIQDVAEQVGREAALSQLAEHFNGLSERWRAMILSDENFLGQMPSPSHGMFNRIEYLCDAIRLLSRDHEVLPLVVLRDHAGWLQSIHGFIAGKSAGTGNTSAFFEGFAAEGVAYRPMLERLAAAAGQGAIMVQAYEDIRSDGGRAFLGHVLAKLSVPRLDSDVLPRANPSVPDGLRILAAVLAEQGLAPSRLAAPRLEKFLSALPGAMPESGGQELIRLLRRSAVPVAPGIPLRNRLKEADEVFRSQQGEIRHLGWEAAAGLSRAFLELREKSRDEAFLLRAIRCRSAEDRAWVAAHYLPGWRG